MEDFFDPRSIGWQIIALIFIVVWMFVPFAILAIRRLLVQSVAQQERTIELLEEIKHEAGRVSSDARR